VWVLSGILIYAFYSRSRALPVESEIQVLEEVAAPKGSEYRIMVPVANPENALSLVWNTHKIGSSRPSRIKLLHMVSVPDQVALGDAGEYMTEGREAIVEAMLYLVQRFPVTTTFRYCRNIARGITSAVREKNIDLLIMGWHGKGGDRRFHIGSTLDPVISRAPCNIVILKGCGSKTFKNILVPLFGDANDAFALDTAERMVQEQDGKITAMPLRRAIRRNRGIWSEERYLERLLRRVAYQPVKVRLDTKPPMDPVKAVIRDSRSYDLVVLGLSGSFLRQVGVPTLSEQIARRCSTPLVLAKVSKGLSALTKRWI
jgi:basic amino acid/polyamine antiporter, APA family